MATLFEKIIKGELPCEKVYENEHILAIKDKYPVAPHHILIITKKVISEIQSLKQEDFFLLGEVVMAAQKIAKDLGFADNYRLCTNNGPTAGQSIHHLHFHLVGGRQLHSVG